MKKILVCEEPPKLSYINGDFLKKRIFNEAVELEHKGRLSEAENLYQQGKAIDPNKLYIERIQYSYYKECKE